jgi:hypothetical protein
MEVFYAVVIDLVAGGKHNALVRKKIPEKTPAAPQNTFHKYQMIVLASMVNISIAAINTSPISPIFRGLKVTLDTYLSKFLHDP